MIAADTVRSKAYLQALLRHQLYPAQVLLLRNPADKPLPGQFERASDAAISRRTGAGQACWSEAGFDAAQALELTLNQMRAPTEIVNESDINHPDVIDKVRGMTQPVLIYSGYGGALLKKEILATGKRFLHVHGGYLPDYKGSTTSYYSLLKENRMGASSLFLTAQIDAGPVLQRRRFPPPPDRLAIDHVYDSAARARVLVDTLKAYVATGSWSFELPDNSGGETYFVIHPVLKHIAMLARSEADRCA